MKIFNFKILSKANFLLWPNITLLIRPIKSKLALVNSLRPGDAYMRQ